MSGPIELYQGAKADRGTGQAISRIERQAQIVRAHDRACADRAATRISDITKVTRHGLAGATVIAVEAEMAARLSPWADAEIASVARTGIAGIRGVIVDLANGA